MRTPKNEDIKFLSFRVPRTFWVRVGKAARDAGISAQAFCVEAIEARLGRAEKKNGNGINGPSVRSALPVIRKSSSEGV